MKYPLAALLWLLAVAGFARAGEIEPTWESMAQHYRVPRWFQDGKIGVWMHWGISSAVDENRPNDGSHYGRRMYGPNEGETGAQLEMTKTLSAWHAKRYGPPSEFGYEKLIPLFKGEKWDPDALVKFFKDNGARFIMPVATHHDIVIKTLAVGGLLAGAIKGVHLLGSTEPIQWKRDASALGIVLPRSLPTQPVVGFRINLH